MKKIKKELKKQSPPKKGTKNGSNKKISPEKTENLLNEIEADRAEIVRLDEEIRDLGGDLISPE
jgi:hypothetical protein